MATARAILERGDIVLIFPEGTRIRPGSLGQAQARRRPAGPGDRRPGRPGGRDRHRGGPPRLADPAAQGAHPRRPRAALPDRRGALQGAGRGGHRPHLAVRDAAVGVARRHAAAPPRRRHRRRHLGHQPGHLPGPRRDRGRARLPHPRAGASAQRNPRERRATSPVFELPEVDPGPARRRPQPRGPRSRRAGRAGQGAAGGRRRPRPQHLASRRGAGRVQGRGAAARDSARRRSPPSAPSPGPSACWVGPPTPPRWWSTAPPSFWPRWTRASARQLADALAGAGLDVTITTDVTGVELAGCAKNAAVARRRRGRRRPGPTSPAPPPARCSPRSTRWRAPRGHAPRPSPGWPAPETWWPPWWRAARATAAPGSCWPRAYLPTEIGRALGQAAEAVDSVPLLASAARGARRGGAGAGRPGRARRGPDRARALDGHGGRAGA